MNFDISTGKATNKRKRIIRRWLYGLIAMSLIATMILAGGCGNTEPVPPSEDLAQVIISQYDKNRLIANLEYDPQLTFERMGDIDMTEGKELSPIEDNLLKKGKDGENILFDESIIGRLIQFNSDWAEQQNEEGEKVAESIVKGSDVTEKIEEKGCASRVAFHQLDIGAIGRDGKDYYVLTREKYTLADPDTAKLTPFEGVYIYKLVSQDDTLLIQDFELLKE
jgi:hypothetical protein